MILTARYLASRDYGQFLASYFDDHSIYSIKPANFWFSKISLPLSSDTEITRYDLRGHVRYRSGPNNPGLQIHFIDNYSTTGSHLQGMVGVDSFMMVTINGHSWDGLSQAGALGIKLDLDEKILTKILNQDAINTIHSMEKVFGPDRSLVIRPTSTALKLKIYLLNFLKKYENKFQFSLDDTKSTAHITTPVILSQDVKLTRLNEEVLINLSKEVIQELHLNQAIKKKLGNNNRRRLALKIEDMLLKHPKSLHLIEEIDLDHLVNILGITRRTIQASIHEHFGVGFVELRRAIRLHQIRSELIKQHSSENIHSIAEKYFITHPGRFSRDYKNLFGLLPSADAKNRTQRYNITKL